MSSEWSEMHGRVAAGLAGRVVSRPRAATLVGQPLADALDWTPSVNPAGCICGPEQLNHKWRIVYHTIAFALEEDAFDE